MANTIAQSNRNFHTITLDGRRKSWHVIGATLNGEAYCASCADESGLSEEHWENGDFNPIFADADTDGLTCGICHDPIA
jgi:hypothetical protein